MARAIGQPFHETHPHILKCDHITPGISKAEYKKRRREFATSLPNGTVAIFPAHRTRYSSLNILYNDCISTK